MKGLALLTVTAACGGPASSVRVVVVWSGWELTQFRRVLHQIPEKRRWRISVQSAGNDLAALVGNRVARTAAPDVALIQQPRMVTDHPARFTPLQAVPDIPQDWANLLQSGRNSYGTWFKAAHKSLVWYRPDRLTSEPPQHWTAWVDMCREMAARGQPPLAIGAADGWVLTDWFENVLLSIDPETYRGLAGRRVSWRHPHVSDALRRMGEIWSIRGAFPGGARRALLTQFDGALVDVFQHGRAAMVAGGDFYYPIIEQYGNAPAKWFRFPCLTTEQPPLIVAGDAAVRLNRDSAGGDALIKWLADPAAAGIWARAGGFLSVNPKVNGYPGDLSSLAEEVQKETVGGPAFDLSDQLGGRLAGADGRGTWKIFQDFFAQVAVDEVPIEDAVRRASDALAAADQARPS
jgi:ABC-type glycerol-3-phosphate transport system substrate-binding protein